MNYLFGLGGNTTRLVNEPTIDYNATNHTRKSILSNKYSKPSIIDYSDNEWIDKDYDDYDRVDTANSRKSLPTDYPGKFNPSVSQENRKSRAYRYNEYGTDNDNDNDNDRYNVHRSEPYRPRYIPELNHNLNHNHSDSNSKPDNKYQSSNYPPYASSNHDLTVKLNRIRNNHHSISTPKSFPFDNLSSQLHENNQVLSKLNDLIDAGKDCQLPQDHLQSKYNDLQSKYDNLKQQYVNNSQKWQGFTDDYLKLNQDFLDLRNSSKFDGKSLTKTKETIRNLKFSTNNDTIKLICDDLLLQCDNILKNQT